MSEMKPYAEPIISEELKKGETYFMLTFFDNHMLVPDLKTLVFLGKDLEEDNLFCFQDIESYITLGPYPQNRTGTGNLYRCPETQLNNIFELEKAIDELQRCAVRRSKKYLQQYEFLR